MKRQIKTRLIGRLRPNFWSNFRRIWQALLTFSLVLFLTLTPSVSGVAQNPTAAELETTQEQAQVAAAADNKIDGYPVVLDGQTLFLIRRGVGSFSAEQRANAIAARLEKIAQDDSIPIDNLKIISDSEEGVTYLTLDKEIILTITPQDARSYRSPREELAKQAFQTIKVALEQYRKDRSPAQLLQSLIYTALSTLALVVIVFSIVRLSGRIFPRFRNWIESRIPGLRIQNFEIVSSYRISVLCLRIMQLIRLFIFLIIIYIYVSFVLSLFPWTRTFSESILNYLFQALELIFNGIASYLPNIFILALIIVITYYLLRAISPFFTAIESGNLVIPGFYPDWAEPTYKLLLILITALAAVVAFPYLPGFDSPAFRGISVFLGILFSLGSTSAVANVVGGVILIYTRAFQIGDRIQVGDIVGDVIEKTLLATRILTVTNKIITIPNASLLSSNVINFSAASRELKRYLILQTTITLGYDLPWRKVHETLIQAALATGRILKDPAPFVLQTSLDDFYISYQLNAYTDQPNLMVRIYSELHQNIQDKCNEVGIEIMSPHYAAMRDGNQSTIPENYLPQDYTAPGFRISPMKQKPPEGDE
jgi:small-conductance mechanosensitive channel